MADAPSLTPEQLDELLRKLDEVCRQAQALRSEIVDTMSRRRSGDLGFRPKVPPPARRATARNAQKR
jgi:hypothetical protein